MLGKEYEWNVVPLCEAQLKDVNPKDILNEGLYRVCDIYKGGGGYDKFEAIYKKRKGITDENVHFNKQFVVQLQGCPLKCPYCYVTEDGIFGASTKVSTSKLLKDFYASGTNVFHLMGGAPAIYIEHWPEILKKMNRRYVFHSDLLLIEKEYTDDVVKKLGKYKNSMYAVSIKGATEEEFKKNTGVNLEEDLLRHNLMKLITFDVPFYFTFTNMSKESVELFTHNLYTRFGKLMTDSILEDSFIIDLVDYEALK